MKMFHIPACLNRGQASPANPQEVCQKHFGFLSWKSLIVRMKIRKRLQSSNSGDLQYPLMLQDSSHSSQTCNKLQETSYHFGNAPY